MRRHAPLLMAVVLVAAACGGSSDSSDATTPAPAPPAPAPTTAAPAPAPTTAAPAPAPTTGAPAPTTAAPTTQAPGPGAVFAITFVTIGPNGQDVVISNVGEGTGSLAGHVLCQFPSYANLPDIELAPGEFVGVSLGGDVFLPPPGAKDTFSLNIGTIRPGSGELALYSSSQFGSSDAIVDYVEWGNSGHTRSEVAVGAGIWGSGDFVATTDATTFMFALEVPSDGAGDWEAG